MAVRSETTGSRIVGEKVECIVGCLSVALPNSVELATGRYGLILWSSILLCSGGEASRERCMSSFAQALGIVPAQRIRQVWYTFATLTGPSLAVDKIPVSWTSSISLGQTIGP